MIRLDDFSGYPFSATDLYTVCEKYAARLVASANAVQLDFEPSESHRIIIRRMADKSLQKARWQMMCRRIAAVAVVIILLFGTIMVTNIHAREAVVRWLRQIFPDHVFYQFFREPSDVFYNYTIGYIPEGFELVRYEEDETEAFYVYKNDIATIVVEFYSLSTYSNLDIDDYNYYEEFTLNNNPAILYINTSTNSNALIVIDELKEMVISINAILDPKEIVKIGESID